MYQNTRSSKTSQEPIITRPPLVTTHSPFRDKPWIWGEKWKLGIIEQPLSDVLKNPDFLNSTHWLRLPWPKGFASDPWLVSHNSDHLVFFEFYDNQLDRGVIACGSLQSNQNGWHLNQCRRIIEEPFHLSHPCVFRYENSWYLIPEAADAGDVILYEATGFPYNWRKMATLLPRVPGLDPIFYQSENSCWIFCSLGRGTDNNNLLLFHAPTLLGPWKPHPSNPIKSDFKGSRPAGPIFEFRDALIRPGQDSRFTYGEQIILHEILAFDKLDFKERYFATIGTNSEARSIHGLHSLCINEQFCLFDAKSFTGLKTWLGPLLASFRKFKARRGEKNG